LTKRSLNNWLRQAGPIFDQSLALVMLTFTGADVREGIQSLREKRPPRYPEGRDEHPLDVRREIHHAPPCGSSS